MDTCVLYQNTSSTQLQARNTECGAMPCSIYDGQSYNSLDTMIVSAVSRGDTDQVLNLVSRGASLTVHNAEGRSLLYLACLGSHLQTVIALLALGCDVNLVEKEGYTALHTAVNNGKDSLTELLIKHNANVNMQDEQSGNTPLHDACWKGYSRIVEMLIRAKADMYLRNKGGFTPLHLACQNGHNQSCRLLLLAGCDADVRNSYGDTALHTSARYGHAGVMRILLSGRAAINEQNRNGDSALHISSAMGRRKLTRILLENNIDIQLKNMQEETAVDIATRKQNLDIVEMIDNLSKILKRTNRKREQKRAKPESGSSSREDSGRHMEKKQRSTEKSKTNIHTEKDGVNIKSGRRVNWSPYGCYSTPQLSQVLKPKLRTLPTEPLNNGEQYYLDLAGNIRKGPIGRGYTCYCAPFFQHVEKKLDSNKKEFMDHIDAHHTKLDKKISLLERRTRTQLSGLNDLMRDRFTRERKQCCDQSEHMALKTKAEIIRQQRFVRDDLTAFLEDKFNKLQVEQSKDKTSIGQMGRSESVNNLTNFNSEIKNALLSDDNRDLHKTTASTFNLLNERIRNNGQTSYTGEKYGKASSDGCNGSRSLIGINQKYMSSLSQPNLHCLTEHLRAAVDNLKNVELLDEQVDHHNDSGYSTKFYGSSQGPSPSLSGSQDEDILSMPSKDLLNSRLSRICEEKSLNPQIGVKSSLV